MTDRITDLEATISDALSMLNGNGDIRFTRKSDLAADDGRKAVAELVEIARATQAAARAVRAEAALREIRDMDYRGNRSQESAIAYRALAGQEGKPE